MRWRFDDLPMVGREREAETLTRLLESVEQEQGTRVVLLSGEPGIGKTRLANEFAEQAASVARVVSFHARKDDALSTPLWMKIVSLLRPDLAPTDAMGLPQAEIDQSIIRLTEEPDRRPIVLVVDDAQWLSFTDANLLRRLAAHREGRTGLLLLIAHRDEAATQDPELQSLLTDIIHERAPLRISLEALSTADVERYLLETLGDGVPTWLAPAVHERTDGNPFLLTEVVSLLHVARPVEYENALRAIPEGVRQVLEYRLSRLPHASASLLSLAAVVGPVFDVALLAKVEGWNPGRVLSALDALIQERVVREVAPHTFRFSHSLLRETILAQASLGERTVTHALIANALEVHDSGRAVFQLAHHYTACAVLEDSYAQKALSYLTLAAGHAERRADWEAAARCHEEIVDRASVLGLTSETMRYLRAIQDAGRCWRLAGQQRRAWSLFMRGIEAARRAGEYRQVATYTIEALAGSDAAPDRRRQLVEQALERGEDLLPETRARLLILLSGYESNADATRFAHQARGLVERHQLSKLCVGLPDRDYYEAMSVGDLFLARTRVERAVMLAVRADDRIAETRYMNRVGELAARAGSLSEAWGIARQTLALAERSRLRRIADHARLTLMAIALAQGRLSSFDNLSREVADSPVAWQLRARRLEVSGEHEVALQRLRAAQVVRSEHPRVAWDFHGTSARLALAAGMRLDARMHLADWIRRRDENQHPVDRHDAPAVIGLALAELGEAGIVRGVLEESETIPSARFSYTSATGLDTSRGHLALRLGENQRARAHFVRGLKWAIQEELPGEAAAAIAGIVTLPSEHVDEDLWELVQAGALLTGGEDEERRPSPSPGPREVEIMNLSDREIEVLELIAAGRSNRQVARVLSISQHTVARHVSNILVKLGATNRAQAATMATRAGLIRSQGPHGSAVE